MNFRTTISPIKGIENTVNFNSPVILIGSCFTDNIGNRLLARGFDALINPCGTLYNPASIASTILDILYERVYTPDDIFLHAGLWHSFGHHTRFSAPDAEQCLDKINRAIASTAIMLRQASALIITFGTAFVFRHNETNQIVANCHKLPPATFTRLMLTATQIHGLWKKIIRELLARNPQLKIIFTISPIRHLADGAHGNAVSKSTLLLAVDKLTADFPDNTAYFPAYEIMMDDLRDYRFYADDMIHPSEPAIDYIYNIFADSAMTKPTIQKSLDNLRLHKRQSHIPLSEKLGL